MSQRLSRLVAEVRIATTTKGAHKWHTTISQD